MSLSQRSISSAKWNMLATVLGFPLGFVQTVLLARLLPVEYFGVFAAVSSIIGLSSTVFEFGLGNAYVHRAPETQDEEHATAAYFTLRLVFDSAWAIFLLAFGLIIMSGMRQWVLIFLVITGYFYRLTTVPQAVLMRRVQHRRLAVLGLVGNFTVALASIAIAWFTHSIWALLVSSIITLVLGIVGFYLWKPVWKPKLAWDKPTVHYFLGFGARNLVNNFLDGALDNSDNLFTGYFLGDLALGYYSRAFRFAIYPRILLTTPVNSVALGTFAELKYDRLRLSKAFFRFSVLLTRAGFLLAGILSVIAPHFIIIFLGVKWLPMLNAFRLMLLFSILDPLRVTISNVLLAVGQPGKVGKVRLVQLIILGIGLFTLGFRYQIAGVALSMDIMLVVGVSMYLWFVREYVDFSLLRLFSPPVIGILAGIGVNQLLISILDFPQADWLVAILKLLAFSGTYLIILVILEGDELYQSFSQVMDLPVLLNKALAWLTRGDKDSS
jgi:O-antigen/teichoic acid export membrane protein